MGFSSWLNTQNTQTANKSSGFSGWLNGVGSGTTPISPKVLSPARAVVSAPVVKSNLPNFPALLAASHPTYKQIMAAAPEVTVSKPTFREASKNVKPLTAAQNKSIEAQLQADSLKKRYPNGVPEDQKPILQQFADVPSNFLKVIGAPATEIRSAIPRLLNKAGTVTNMNDVKKSGYYSLQNMISDLSGTDTNKAISSVPHVGGALNFAANLVGDTATDPLTGVVGLGFGTDAVRFAKLGKAGALEDALNIAPSVKRASELADASKLFDVKNAAQVANVAKNATPIFENGSKYENVSDRQIGETVNRARAYSTPSKQLLLPTKAEDARPQFYAPSQGGAVTKTLGEQPKLLTARSQPDKVLSTAYNIRTGTKNFYPTGSFDDFSTIGGVSENQMAILDDMAKNPQNIQGYKESFDKVIPELQSEYDKTVNEVADQIYNYKGQGTTKIPIHEDYGVEANSYRVSNNPEWYQGTNGNFSKATARQMAVAFLNDPKYAGELYDEGMVEKVNTLKEYKPFYDDVFGGDNVIGVTKAADGSFDVHYGNKGTMPLQRNVTNSITPAEWESLKNSGATPQRLSELNNPLKPSTTLPNTLLPKVDNIAAKVENPSTVATDSFGKQTVGAAEYKSTVTKDLIDKYGQIDTGENPTRIMQIPNKTADNMAVSKYVRTVGESKNVTDAQAISLENKAAKGDFSHIIKTDKAAVASADRVISDEGISGSTRQWERVSTGTKLASKEDMALAQQLLTQAYARGDIRGAERLVSQITVEGTRSGQVVQSMRLLKKMTPQGKLYYLQKFVDKANADLSLKIGDRATKIEISPELANQLLGATTVREIGDAEKQIIIEVAKQIPPTWGDRLNAWRYMSMLANPLTHLRNIYGNTFFVPVRKFASLITAGAEKVMRVPIGERTSSVLIPFKDKALKDFARNDYKEIGDILHGGKFNENSNIINDNKPIFVSKNKVTNTVLKPLETTRKGSMWGLSHGDIFFSKPAYTDYMSQYMKANKLTPEFLGSGTNEAEAALEKGRTYAIQQAKRATFNEANSFATWINQSEKKLLQKGVPGKVGYMAIEGLTPFKKTPFNIVKRGLEYSPLNLIKSVSTDLIKVNTGKMEATDAIRHFAEGLTGTGLMGLGMFLSAQGLITGKIDTTGKENAFDAQNGAQEYSLNIGNSSYTINWLAPEIMPVMMGAEIYQSFSKDHPNDTLGASVATFNHLLDATTSISDPVFNLTMLQGVNNLFSQSFGQSITQQLIKPVTGFANQFVPTVLGQAARISQPNRKDTSSSNPVYQMLGTNKIMAKIPVLANTLPDKMDLWGNPISNGGIGQRLFTNLLSPGYLSTANTNKVNTEVERLYTATNDSGALPTVVPNYVEVNGKQYYFTAKEKQRFSTTMGKAAANGISALIGGSKYRGSKDYVKGNTPDKLGMLEKVYATAKQQALAEFKRNRGLK